MTGIRGKFVPDIRDLPMAGVKSYTGRIKAQYVNHLSQSVSGIRRVFTARVVCVRGRSPSPNGNRVGKVIAGIRAQTVIGMQALTVAGIGNHLRAWIGAQSGPEPGQCASTQGFLTSPWSWVRLGK